MASTKAKCVLAAAVTVLSACAGQQPQPIIQTMQSGDGALTCEQISAEVQRLNQVAYGSAAAGDPAKLLNAGPGAQTVVNEIAAIGPLAVLRVLPAVNGVVTAAGGLMGNAYRTDQQEQANTAGMARQRVQYLTGLYRENHCAATEVSRTGSRMRATALAEDDQP